MFSDREEAGILLASLLLKDQFKNSVIVAIPRGGVVVGKTVSKILKILLYVLIVKKIVAPNNPELAIGATGPPTGGGGIVFWDHHLISDLKISDAEKIKALKETLEIIRLREQKLELKLPKVKNKTTIVVDDGVATGATAIVASKILKKLGSEKIILATPVISIRTKKEISKYFDKIISFKTPLAFRAVGQFYRNFPQIEDEEIRAILRS